MKKAPLISLLLVSILGGVTYYFWHQATKLPEWYQTQAVISQPIPVKNIESFIESKVKPVPNTNTANRGASAVEVSLTDAEVNNLILSGIAQATPNREIPKFIKGVNTRIHDGTVETGAIVNLSELGSSNISEKEKAALTKLTHNLPFLGDREVYVGLVGQPTLKDGKVNLDKATKIQVGTLTLTVAEIAQRLGITEEQLQQTINLNLGKIKVEDLEFLDNNVIIRGLAEEG